MMTFVAILHVIVALILIVLVLIQDSKSGAMGSAFGGGGSNSVLGATGAQTLAAKLTRWAAVIFAVTCVGLTMLTTTGKKSVIDASAIPQTPVETTATPEAAEQTSGATTPATTPAAATESAPTEAPKK